MAVVVYGRCKEDCYAVMDEVKQILQIEVRTPAGEIKGIQW